MHHYKLRVGEDGARRAVVEKILHVLRDARGEGVALAEAPPCGVEEHTAVRIVIHHMELIEINMGAPAVLPILRHAVEDGVRDNEQAHRFKLFAQIENVIDHDAVVGVHIGWIGKGVQAALGEKLHRKRKITRLRLGLHKQKLTQGKQRGQRAASLVVLVEVARAAVNDALVL